MTTSIRSITQNLTKNVLSSRTFTKGLQFHLQEGSTFLKDTHEKYYICNGNKTGCSEQHKNHCFQFEMVVHRET